MDRVVASVIAELIASTLSESLTIPPLFIDRLKLEVMPMTPTARQWPARFSAYEIYPVVKERRRDGRVFRHTCRALKDAYTFIEESARVAHLRPHGSFAIIWSIYGRRRRNGLELIADRPDQEAVFDLLYSMTGFHGISGQNVYQLPLGTSVVNKTAVMRRLKAAIAAIENYKDEEEMDSLAFAEEVIEEVKAVVEAGSKAALSNQERPVTDRGLRRPDRQEVNNEH